MLSIRDLYGFSATIFAMGVFIALGSRLAPGGETIIDVSTGRLMIDHCEGQQHDIRQYTASQLKRIWVDRMIVIDDGSDRLKIMTYAAPSLRNAAVEVMGTLLWGDGAVVRRRAPNNLAYCGVMLLVVEPPERVGGAGS